MAGYRSPLAFWVGGAAASPAPDASPGKRSLLAPWLGGASAPAAAQPSGGRRSLVAPWLGGASAPAAAPAGGGYRSLHAFWLGGACANPSVLPPEPGPAGGGGRYYVPQELRDRFRKQRKDEDEFLMALLLNAIPGLLRRH